VRRFSLRSLPFGPSDEAWVELPVEVEPFILGGETYEAEGGMADLDLTIARVGDRYTLSGEVVAVLVGPCQRCLEEARIEVVAEGTETALRGESEGVDDEDEPYVSGWSLDVGRWVRDLIGTALPLTLLCRDDCRGLCPVCGADLNKAGPGHRHEPE